MLNSDTRFFENGMHSFQYDNAPYWTSKDVYKMTHDDAMKVGTIIDMPVANYKSVGYENVTQFMTFYFVMMFMSFIALCFEFVKINSQNYKKKLINIKMILNECYHRNAAQVMSFMDRIKQGNHCYDD